MLEGLAVQLGDKINGLYKWEISWHGQFTVERIWDTRIYALTHTLPQHIDIKKLPCINGNCLFLHPTPPQ